MAGFDEESVFGARPPKARPAHEIGQPLETLSVDELRERVTLLQAEIARLEIQAAAKESSRKAAEGFFQRGG